jgi:AraC family transcriptional regulator of adaptative response/methylated-DNA-[protein]-cysteine methyltransferase
LTGAVAEAAGYRACRRCRPGEPGLAARHASAVTAACRTIESSPEPPRLDALAQAAGMSRFHFQRVFKKMTGLSPKAFAHARRAERVRGSLTRHRTVTDALYAAGFNSNGRFYAASAKILGMNPKYFRAGGIGAEIRFAVAACSLGSIIVAASDRGVCFIAMGDDAKALVKNLHDRFPKARISAGGKPFERTVAQVIRFVEKPRLGLNLPLDIRGTAFQRRVWQALTEIPPGATANYAQIAQRIGAPKSMRAVAGACGANPLAVVVPCHRVIRSDGSLSGYRWGVERKRALLKREQAVPAARRRMAD